MATEESKYKRNPEVFVRPKMPAINPEKQADSCQEEKRRISANVSSSDRRTTCLFARVGPLQYSIYQKGTHSTDRR